MCSVKVKPFLKWAGGKTQLLDEIEKVFPFGENQEFTYVEPFVGSGAVLFWVLNNYKNVSQIIINDINKDLIDTYRSISNNIDTVIALLKKWQAEYYSLSSNEIKKKAYYYDKRKLFNTRESDDVTQAALFIFLNRTCFNGLYRVNKKNQFNVPIGSYKRPLICDEVNLRSVSRALKNVIILNGDFERTLQYVPTNNTNVVFYLDPPYKPLSSTANFNSYTKDRFGDNEQIRLKTFCDKLDFLGYSWILSNSDPKSINPSNNFFDELYNHYTVNRVLARRNINSKGSQRGLLNELLITNSKR